MDKAQGTKRFPLLQAYPFGVKNGLEREVDEIRNMEVEWDRPYSASVRRGRMIELFQEHQLLDRFIANEWSVGKTSAGQSEMRRCLRIEAEYSQWLSGNPQSAEPDTDEEEANAFALEAHLRDFLAKNMEKVGKGLRLYEVDGTTGREFEIDNGRIDLLAVDRNGKFVVIELKLSMGRNKTLGQLLYYMGWVDKHLGNGPCRGIIIASDVTDDLKVAASRVPGVSLARYRLTFSVEALIGGGP